MSIEQTNPTFATLRNVIFCTKIINVSMVEHFYIFKPTNLTNLNDSNFGILVVKSRFPTTLSI
jgi:hypothetical protein